MCTKRVDASLIIVFIAGNDLKNAILVLDDLDDLLLDPVLRLRLRLGRARSSPLLLLALDLNELDLSAELSRIEFEVRIGFLEGDAASTLDGNDGGTDELGRSFMTSGVVARLFVQRF